MAEAAPASIRHSTIHLPSHYIFQAVPLVDQCRERLQKTIEKVTFGRNDALLQLKESLVSTDQLLKAYLLTLLEHERNGELSLLSSPSWSQKEANNPTGPSSIILPPHLEDDRLRWSGVSSSARLMEILQRVIQEKHQQTHFGPINAGTNRRHLQRHPLQPCPRNPQDPTPREKQPFGSTRRNAVDTLLFRLIVTLQLLLVRIDDAHYVITGHAIDEGAGLHHETKAHVRYVRIGFVCAGAGFATSLLAQKYGNERVRTPLLGATSRNDNRQLLVASAKVGASFLGLALLNRTMKGYWMTDKICRSNAELLEWNLQWELIHRTPTSSVVGNLYNRDSSSNGRLLQDLQHPWQQSPNTESRNEEFLDLDDKSRMLIEYAMKHSHRTSYFWRSQGEIRFLMLKRFMDVYYASVGTAINTKHTSALALPLVTGAAASFYTITGVSKQSLSVVNDSSRDLIQHAWGMVSLPAIKTLMLQASRLLKGASVADRISFCGVPCFILSKDPAPELATALKREAKRRSGTSTAALSQLSTITETEIHCHDEETTAGRRKSFAGSCGSYRQRDVILHLTGGGFFAHTIASDLPYLLDWSSSTGAVVVCPEYALLPENPFPAALEQITKIYSALASGDTGPHLGFEVNRICVTGESAGGNLAAALCVKLAMHKIETVGGDDSCKAGPPSTWKADGVSPADGPPGTMEDRSHRMPDAIMLSCPALNLTTELSYSRVVGTEDPVLPSGLISAISEAYVPKGQQGFDKKDPLVSPFFASDAVLQWFPPALLFASSKDPLLDDSVTFNERLRVVGVSSELIAVHNVPHAYLGLGTAGFPEAVQVQRQAIEFLSSKLKE